MKSKILLGYLRWRGQSIFFMAWQKVAGELVSPKYMTVGSYSPKGVLKVAFQRSSSLMRVEPPLDVELGEEVFPLQVVEDVTYEG